MMLTGKALVLSLAMTIACLAGEIVAGQEGGGPRKTPIAGCSPVSRDFYPCAKAKAAAFKPPRNPDGTPSMNGAWNPATANGSQNIEDYRGDAFLNPQITLIVDPPDGKVPYLPQ